MEGFSVNITITDCCSNKCRTISNSTTQIITSLNDFISLQCCYYLKIIAVTSTYIVLSIDNGIIHFVRRSFIGVPLRICIPNNCSTHIITIIVNSITVN